MAFIGLDVGTTGCKATVVDTGGSVLAYAYREYTPYIPAKGRGELDANEVWDAVKDVLGRAAGECGAEIDAIAAATFGEVFVLVDQAGNVLSRAILYSDERGTDEQADIAAKIDGNTLYGIVGLPISSMYSLAKLLWVKKHTDDYDKAKYIMLFGDYIAWRLTGERRIDYSLASRTSLFDVRKKQWSDNVASRFGIDTRKLSKPIATGQVIGSLRESVAEETGISKRAVLVAGAHDQICAALGAGVLNEGECVDGMGTSECITTMLGDIDQTDTLMKNSFCVEPYIIEDRYVTLAFHLCAGAMVDWYRTTIDKDRNERFKREGKSIHAAMEQEAPQAPTTLFVLPHMAGTGTPYMDAAAEGAILGLKLSTTRGEVYKACLEGMCFEIMHNAALLKSIGTHISSLVCVGGVSQSDMLLQIKADVMGIPVTRLKFKESGIMGLAIMSYTATGHYGSLGQAADVMVRYERTFEPNMQNHAVYQDKYAVYQNIYKGIKAIYQR